MAGRKSKRLHWELMLQLEEAGEEDICALLNQVMGSQPYFGSGVDLSEYLDALTALEALGELRVRQYRIEEGRTVYLDCVGGGATRPESAFNFDIEESVWMWKPTIRQMVEVSDK